MRLAIILTLLACSLASAQSAYEDTLYLESGGMLIGEIHTYPPKNVVIFYDDQGIYTTIPLDQVDAIYPAMHKRIYNEPGSLSPAVATFLGFSVPGLGMAAAGHPRGYMYIALAATTVALTIAGSHGSDGFGAAILGFACYSTIWGISIIDTPIAVTGLRNDMRRIYPYQSSIPDWNAPVSSAAPGSGGLSMHFSIPLQ